jgi:hypothetical protein
MDARPSIPNSIFRSARAERLPIANLFQNIIAHSLLFTIMESPFEVALTLRLRLLEPEDFSKSFLGLLSQLSDVGGSQNALVVC